MDLPVAKGREMSGTHAAGGTMSRAEAKRRSTVADHIAATSAVECRKDKM